MITDRAASETVTDLGNRCHPACSTCGVENGGGLSLQFAAESDGTVVGPFACQGKQQGYPDQLHGGVVAMLADAAVTHGLFVHRIKAVTDELKLRFAHPVEGGATATVRVCREMNCA